MTSGNGDRQEALAALTERGVTPRIADELLELAAPAAIVAACERWDRDESGAGTLVWRVRNGDLPKPAPPPGARAKVRAATFRSYARRFPEGSVAEPHARLQARRYADEDPCPGQLVVFDLSAQMIVAECDRCGEVWTYTARSLHVLGPALELAETEPTPEPDSAPF